MVWSKTTNFFHGETVAHISTPIPHRFMRQGDAMVRHEFCDIAIAEGEMVIRPDAVPDSLDREPMMLIQVGSR
jgi:hypothetical protein